MTEDNFLCTCENSEIFTGEFERDTKDVRTFLLRFVCHFHLKQGEIDGW